MKKFLLGICSIAAFGIGFMFTGCDWSSGGSDFNTSGGGANINISGFYRGTLGNGFAVLRKEGGAIFSFVIQQSGNTLQVTDSNGQTYSGIKGGASSIFAGSGDSIPGGATVAAFQVSWSGTDGTAGIEIEFTGVINLVATTVTVAESEIRVSNQGGGPNDEVQEINTVQERIFTFAEDNSQFLLKGTWIEANGGASPVEAIAPGAGQLALQDLTTSGSPAITVPQVPLPGTNSTVSAQLSVFPPGPNFLLQPFGSQGLTASGGSGAYSWSTTDLLIAQPIPANTATTTVFAFQEGVATVTLTDGLQIITLTFNVVSP